MAIERDAETGETLVTVSKVEATSGGTDLVVTGFDGERWSVIGTVAADNEEREAELLAAVGERLDEWVDEHHGDRATERRKAPPAPA